MRRKNISVQQHRESIRNAILREDYSTLEILLNNSTDNLSVIRALRQVVYDLAANDLKNEAWNAIFKCSDFTATQEFKKWQEIPYSPTGAKDALIELFYQYCNKIIATLKQAEVAPTLFSSVKP